MVNSEGPGGASRPLTDSAHAALKGEQRVVLGAGDGVHRLQALALSGLTAGFQHGPVMGRAPWPRVRGRALAAWLAVLAGHQSV